MKCLKTQFQICPDKVWREFLLLRKGRGWETRLLWDLQPFSNNWITLTEGRQKLYQKINLRKWKAETLCKKKITTSRWAHISPKPGIIQYPTGASLPPPPSPVLRCLFLSSHHKSNLSQQLAALWQPFHLGFQFSRDAAGPPTAPGWLQPLQPILGRNIIPAELVGTSPGAIPGTLLLSGTEVSPLPQAQGINDRKKAVFNTNILFWVIPPW